MSKGLDALNIIGNYQVCINYGLDEYEAIKNVIPNSFDTIQKELKVLEIIKEKRVNAFALSMSKTLESYNNLLYVYPERQLTQEEYELLKEVLL